MAGKRVLLTGGGTGGHIYPALALKKEWEKRYPDTEFLYIGTKNGLESKLAEENGIPFKSIDIQGFSRRFSLDNIRTVQKFIKSVSLSKKYIKAFKPDVVLGTGGYVCGPVVYAAKRLNVPSVIHEQNSVPGVANKFLARYVDGIALSFEDAKIYFGENADKCQLTGNPRAQEVIGVEAGNYLEEYNLSSMKPTVLIFGGSRGAQKINETVAELIPLFPKRDYQVLIASGETYYPELSEVWNKSTSDEAVQVRSYISNMLEVYTNVDLVVCRSGATSIAELTSLGVPSILIPSPNVTEDHQTKNAMSVVEAGAAEIIKEDDLTSGNLLSLIDELMENDEKRMNMANKAKETGIQDAADRLMDMMLEVMVD